MPMAMKRTPIAIGPYRPPRLSVMPLHIDIIRQAAPSFASALTVPMHTEDCVSSLEIVSLTRTPSDSITPPTKSCSRIHASLGRGLFRPLGAAWPSGT